MEKENITTSEGNFISAIGFKTKNMAKDSIFTKMDKDTKGSSGTT